MSSDTEVGEQLRLLRAKLSSIAKESVTGCGFGRFAGPGRGVLLVVWARWGPRDAIRRAFANLKPETVLAVLFNDYKAILPRHAARAYRDYGKED